MCFSLRMFPTGKQKVSIEKRTKRERLGLVSRFSWLGGRCRWQCGLLMAGYLPTTCCDNSNNLARWRMHRDPRISSSGAVVAAHYHAHGLPCCINCWPKREPQFSARHTETEGHLDGLGNTCKLSMSPGQQQQQLF